MILQTGFGKVHVSRAMTEENDSVSSTNSANLMVFAVWTPWTLGFRMYGQLSLEQMKKKEKVKVKS